MRLTRAIASANWLLLSSVYRRTVLLGQTGAIISFTFDDFPRSAYTSGGAILRAHGARGTYYASMGLIDSTSSLGAHFSADDLRGLVADGHELANHTFSHLSSRRTSTADYVANTWRGSEALDAYRTPQGAANFSYPFGHVTLGAKRAVSAMTRSCRGTRDGINGPEVDLNLLLANPLYGWCFDLQAAQRLILENASRRGWLIFYTHDVRDSPSRYGCTPSQFESVVRAASLGGARIMTISEALAALGAC
ncbi:MAG: polysaccharide deacetylase family protein [Gammaproteobacteria bacterium]